ncbi:Malyl-CoA lyase [Rhodococcus opacus PD630]|nr:Malyl-CoA lyase [Rhodococcus opacus PD630]
MSRTQRPRRSCLAVPGSNPKMIEKAKGLDSDQVFLDLEDACAPLAKPGARKTIVAALNEGGWGSKIRVVRVNDLTTHWTYRDVVEVVEGAGQNLDCIMLPKVQSAAQIAWLDFTLTQIEKTMGFEVGRIGIEAQIEDAAGLINVDEIAAASPRTETIIFGPGDFMASINMKSLVIGEQPPGYGVGDAFHYPLMRILICLLGQNLDCIMLPKVQSAAQIAWLDFTLTQIEKTMGFEVGRIGIEAQIEDAAGLINVDEIAAASPRTETVIFGPGDFMASINMKSLVIGEQPPGYGVGDAFHYPLMRILMAARANGLQAIDGPYVQVRNVEGFRRVAGQAAALGYDGKWVLHPAQIDAANDTFSPAQADYDHAENILAAYEWFTSDQGGRKGAVMLGDEMIDEASRKMALVIAGQGRAAGMERLDVWKPEIETVESGV